MTLQFDTAFDPRHGEAVQVAPKVARSPPRTADRSPSTAPTATSSGPRLWRSSIPVRTTRRTWLPCCAAIGGRPVSHILVSHTHRDHSPLARPLAELTGAAMSPRDRTARRPLDIGEANPLDASADMEFRPTAAGRRRRRRRRRLALRAVLTPGHTANHAAFALDGTGILFRGDHVMAWATTIVAPPDGSMADYMASLDRLMERNDRTSTCRDMVARSSNPATFVRGLKAHRKMRERAIVERMPTATAPSPTSSRRSIAIPIRGCMARPACRCWRISKTSARSAASCGRSDRDRRNVFRPKLVQDASRRRLARVAMSASRPVEESDDARGVVAEIVAAVARHRAHVDQAAALFVGDPHSHVDRKSVAGTYGPSPRWSPLHRRRGAVGRTSRRRSLPVSPPPRRLRTADRSGGLQPSG